MLKWLESYFEKDDEKFMQIIRDSGRAEKHLSDLYQSRITISILFLAIVLIWVLLTIIFSPSNDSGTILGSATTVMVLGLAIDSRIKMIRMINYIKSTLKPETDNTPE